MVLLLFLFSDTARMTDGGGGGTGGMSFPMKVHTDDEDFVIELEGNFLLVVHQENMSVKCIPPHTQ